MGSEGEPYGLDVDRRVAPFEAAAILGCLAQAFAWDLGLPAAGLLLAVLLLIAAALVLGGLRGFPRPVNLALACTGLGLALWPWAGPSPQIRAALTFVMVVIVAALHYLPWQRLPAPVRLVVPVGAVLSTGLLGYADLAGPWLVFPLLLLVVLWTALAHGTADLVLVMVLALGAQLAVSAAHTGWLLQTPAYGGLLLLVGAIAHTLVRRSRQAAVSSAAVAEVLRSLVEGRDSGSIRQSLCGTLADLLGAPSVGVFELSADGGMLAPTAAVPRIPDIQVALSGEVFGRDGVSYGTPEPPVAVLEAFCRAEPVFRPSLRALARTGELGEVEDGSGLQATYCQPVMRDGKPVAVLAIAWRRAMSQVPADQARLVAELADEVGVLLAHADLRGRVEALARTDSLTKVANRRHWESELSVAISRAQREHAAICVAVLDLDQFKAVNDDLGHQAGDRLLHEIAARWSGGLRQGDLLGRYGGDEFALILPSCEVEEALDVVERLRALSIEDGPFSAGLARWDETEHESDLLLRADAALYDAKRAGGGQTRVAPDRSAASEAWIGTLHAALAGAPITIALQPIKRLEDGAVLGWEALSRFDGLGDDVEPLFQAARRLGVSRDLDWLCRQAAINQAGDRGEPLFINTSVWSLLDARHPPTELVELVTAAGRSPAGIVLELSERDRLNDSRVQAAVQAYRDSGFSFALDDLGAGHSTLEMLICIDADYFKIASGLLRAADKRSQAAVSALTHFAARTGGKVVAEGLETRAHVARARELGIELGQGYLLGRPLAAGLSRQRTPAGL